MSDTTTNANIPRLINKIIDLYGCVIQSQDVYYVSAPITTGFRFLEWFSKEGCKIHDTKSPEFKSEHEKNVKLPNIESAKQKIADLREQLGHILIDPTKLECPEWEQQEYLYFWCQVIERYAKTVIFIDGWQFSAGCSAEFLKAIQCNKKIFSEDLKPLSLKTGIELIYDAVTHLKTYSLSTSNLKEVLAELKDKKRKYTTINNMANFKDLSIFSASKKDSSYLHHKDKILDELAFVGNIAQFVSFAPGSNRKLELRYSRISGYQPNYNFPTPRDAIVALIEKSPEKQVNIRSFLPSSPKGKPLKYGLSLPDQVVRLVTKYSEEGLHCIVNETVDVKDGGVSGVALGDIIEFSPDNTPKCVDEKGICSLPRSVGLKILTKVYGFIPAVSFKPEYRVEFSTHPKERGLTNKQTILWELEYIGSTEIRATIEWPNNFSKFLGDKVFGLLVADVIGLPVPKTNIINRRIRPFQFGISTGTNQYWIRTSPETPVKGKYPTFSEWQDPFAMVSQLDFEMQADSTPVPIKSIIAQEGVKPIFSGALIPTSKWEEPIIEGVKGKGDEFMMGQKKPEDLPSDVISSVKKLNNRAVRQLGPVKIEWVFDSQKAWVVQIHTTKRINVAGSVIYPGNKNTIYHTFYTKGKRLDDLREMLKTLNKKTDGIELIGDVGLTSHYGDILIDEKIPSMLKRSEKMIEG